MDLARNIFGSTIGRKLIMAVTGVVLIAFVVGHLVGNLQVFEDPDRINGYAHLLQSLGPALWAARIILLACVVLHIWAGTTLAIEDRRARGGQPYERNRWIRATVASRYMRWTGYVVLAFILYHLAQFTLGVAQPATFKANLPAYTMRGDYHVLGFTAVRAGTQVLDVRQMVIRGFGNPVVSVFYIVAIGLLSVHLLHGGESLFQTLGWRNQRWSRGLRGVVAVLCAAYFLGNLAIPGGVLMGFLR
ncbi:MAG TPA: succinate dehydrogenase cytochrome b subunit [Opitutaceae bacterium]|jgi:succinate dehydrogenase / fumarate reductase cytochrome b subunit